MIETMLLWGFHAVHGSFGDGNLAVLLNATLLHNSMINFVPLSAYIHSVSYCGKIITASIDMILCKTLQ